MNYTILYLNKETKTIKIMKEMKKWNIKNWLSYQPTILKVQQLKQKQYDYIVQCRVSPFIKGLSFL